MGGRGGGLEAYRVEKIWGKEMVMEWLGDLNHRADPNPPEWKGRLRGTNPVV